MISSPTIPTACLPLRNERAGAFLSFFTSYLPGVLSQLTNCPKWWASYARAPAAVAFAGASSPPKLYRCVSDSRFGFPPSEPALYVMRRRSYFQFQQRHDPPRMPRCTRVAGPSTTRELCASQVRVLFSPVFPGRRGFRPPTATYITVAEGLVAAKPGREKEGNNCRESALADPRTRIRM